MTEDNVIAFPVKKTYVSTDLKTFETCLNKLKKACISEGRAQGFFMATAFASLFHLVIYIITK